VIVKRCQLKSIEEEFNGLPSAGQREEEPRLDTLQIFSFKIDGKLFPFFSQKKLALMPTRIGKRLVVTDPQGN